MLEQTATVDEIKTNSNPFTSDFKYSDSLIPLHKETEYDENSFDEDAGETSYQDGSLLEVSDFYDSPEKLHLRSPNKRDQIKDKNNKNKYSSKLLDKRNSINDHHKYKKVQVQAEETGVPRVQVNAGYDNPEINCIGNDPCAGVLLFWKLTFYGSD